MTPVVFIPLGAAIGAALGVALDNVALGVAVGVGLGVAGFVIAQGVQTKRLTKKGKTARGKE